MPLRELMNPDLTDVDLSRIRVKFMLYATAQDKIRGIENKIRGNGSVAVVPCGNGYTLFFWDMELGEDREYVKFMGYPVR